MQILSILWSVYWCVRNIFLWIILLLCLGHKCLFHFPSNCGGTEGCSLEIVYNACVIREIRTIYRPFKYTFCESPMLSVQNKCFHAEFFMSLTKGLLPHFIWRRLYVYMFILTKHTIVCLYLYTSLMYYFWPFIEDCPFNLRRNNSKAKISVLCFT